MFLTRVYRKTIVFLFYNRYNFSYYIYTLLCINFVIVKFVMNKLLRTYKLCYTYKNVKYKLCSYNFVTHKL